MASNPESTLTLASILKSPYPVDMFDHAECGRRIRALGPRPPWYRPLKRRSYDSARTDIIRRLREEADRIEAAALPRVLIDLDEVP